MEPIFDNTEFRKEFRKNERVRNAAPDLLEALKNIVEALEPPPSLDFDYTVQEDAKALIAKVEATK